MLNKDIACAIARQIYSHAEWLEGGKVHIFAGLTCQFLVSNEYILIKKRHEPMTLFRLADPDSLEKARKVIYEQKNAE